MSYKTKAKSDGVETDGGSLMCSAHGCPMKWSVQIEAPLCSYHAFEEAKAWPGITEALRRDGPWRLGKREESPGVRDMKSRVRKGFSFEPLMAKAA